MEKINSFIIKKVKTPLWIRKIIPNKLGQKLVLMKSKMFESVVKKEGGAYDKIELTEKQIKEGEYMKHIGGESKEWDIRGEFQLDLMLKLGLKKTDSFLDYGCGPLRAGTFLIKFLNRENYFGVDYNSSFIKAGEYIIKNDSKLKSKNPHLMVLPDFNLELIKKKFNYLLLFSVLNHCSELQRQKFFKKVGLVMEKKTKVVITHAQWFDSSYIKGTGLFVSKSLKSLDDLGPNIEKKIKGWGGIDGFDSPKFTFPILILERK